MALIARAGAFFILPLIVLWGAKYFKPETKKISWKFLCLSICILLIAFATNQYLVYSFGPSDTIPFGNFSYSLYGLASGGNSWSYVFKVYPDIIRDVTDEKIIYQLAINLILKEPGLLLKGIIKNISVFFSNSGYGAYSFMAGETQLFNQIAYWLLIGFCGLGIVSWFKNLKDPFSNFIVISTIGILLSVPFLPPTDTFRVRAHAADIITFGLLPAIGLHFLLQVFSKASPKLVNFATVTNRTFRWGKSMEIFSVLLIIGIIFGPFFLRGRETKPQLNGSSCDDSLTSIIVRYDVGTNINLVPQNVMFQDWAPQLHIGSFRSYIHDFPDSNFIQWSDEAIKAGYSLFYGLEYRTNSKVIVLLPSDILPFPPVVAEICGQWETEETVSFYNIFLADSVARIID